MFSMGRSTPEKKPGMPVRCTSGGVLARASAAVAPLRPAPAAPPFFLLCRADTR